MALARDLVLEPAAAKSPEALAAPFPRSARRWEQPSRSLRKPDRCYGLGGLAGVGAGSTRSAAAGAAPIPTGGGQGIDALVGKGITFDSGGLSLKTAELMEPMKSDMAGAAAVVATLQAVAGLGLPLDVEVITPLADNLQGRR